MSKAFMREVAKYVNAPIASGDAGHDQLANDIFPLLDPTYRQFLIDAHDQFLPENHSASEFAEHYALRSKLKRAHETMRRAGR